MSIVEGGLRPQIPIAKGYFWYCAAHDTNKEP